MARRLCCRCVERWHRWVLAFAVLGMVGFVGSLAAVAASWLRIAGFLGAMSGCLAAYAMSLLIGHLGDPLELRRREPSEDEPARAPRSPQVSSDAWWQDESGQELDRTASGWAS